VLLLLEEVLLEEVLLEELLLALLSATALSLPLLLDPQAASISAGTRRTRARVARMVRPPF
jgi:hypothetical protein